MIQVSDIEPLVPYSAMGNIWQLEKMGRDDVFDLGQVQQEHNQEVSDYNAQEQLEVSKNAIVSQDYYADFYKTLFLGYTFEEFLQLYFTLKKIKISFVGNTSVSEIEVYSYIEGKTTDRAFNFETNFYPTHYSTNPLRFSNEEDILTTLPFQRCCLPHIQMAGHYPTQDEYRNTTFWKMLTIGNPTFGYVYKYLDENSEVKFGLNIDYQIQLNLNHFGGNSYVHGWVGERAFRAFLSTNDEQDYYTWKQIPVTFIDGDKVINASTWMHTSNFDWARVNSWDGAVTIEIIRYEEPIEEGE